MGNNTDGIEMSDLTGDQKDLAELIGLANYLRIVKSFGGTTIYIRKLDSILQNDRDRSICELFDGYNFRELAIRFNLSERAIRDIVSPILRQERSKPLDNQLMFEDVQ